MWSFSIDLKQLRIDGCIPPLIFLVWCLIEQMNFVGSGTDEFILLNFNELEVSVSLFSILSESIS
jgi:hypothetical protein